MKVPGAAWSDEQILDVLRRVAADEPKAAIARSYGITARSIRHLLGCARASRLAHEYSIGLHNRAESPTVGPFPCFPDMRPAHNAEQHNRQQIASGSVPASYAGRSGSSPDAGSHERDTIPSAAPNYTGVIQGGAERPDPRKDPSLHVPVAPNGYHLRGVSTLVNAEGQPVQTWVKTTQDRDADLRERIMAAIRSLPEPFRAAHQPTTAPRTTDADLLCLYPVADAHFGMYAWGEESGADYDIDIAERLHLEAIRDLTEHAPNAEQALVCSLGDFLHCDSNLARTTQSGNPLDTDTRWQKVLRVGVRTFRAIVDAALSKHKSVRVVSCRGNHDSLSSYMLALAIEAFYERDSRVSVDTSPAPFHWFRFGRCMFGMTHGDGPKAEQLPGIMATMRPVDWGATSHRRWLTGHVHHKRLAEHPGCIVESFGATAAKDAWTAGMGYLSERDMRVDTYHREDGLRAFYRSPIRSAA
jgi:hypothetical protein